EETAFWGHRHDDPSSRRNRQPSSDRRNGTSSVLNSEQDLDSIPTARGGLSRLAIARLKSADVPMSPLLRCVGTDAEAIVDLEERLSVRSQTALLDEAAIALKDDYLGFTPARDFDSPNVMRARTPSQRLHKIRRPVLILSVGRAAVRFQCDRYP